MSAKKESTHSIKRLLSIAATTFFGVAGIVVLVYFGLPALLSVSYSGPLSASPAVETPPPPPEIVHLETPHPLKAIYMSQCVAGTRSFRDSLVKLINTTSLNAVVIDIKDYTGKIAFPTQNLALVGSVSEKCGAADMKSFVEMLHSKNIYVIGRITVFQDPYYTSLHPEAAVQKASGGVWKDYKGLAFVDVGAKAFWDHIVAISKESYALGFDELNFDYIRFPSDGPMSEAVFSHSRGKSKAQALEEFFKYLTDALHPTGAILSADLFGMTATVESDMGIGQVLERALPYFDYIYPMVYPSHYPSGFNGYKNVNDHPYEIVKFAMDTAIKRTLATTTTIASFAYTPIASTSPQLYMKPSYDREKIRPWLQSFDYPVTYTPAMVEAQITASGDAGVTSWLFWDAANKYNALSRVLLRVN